MLTSRTVIFVLAIALGLSGNSAVAGLAHEAIAVHSKNQNSPDPGQGSPRGTKVGTGRGCSAAEKLIPFVLEREQEEERILSWGLATRPDPSFWVYVPYDIEMIQSARFSLRRQDTEIVYEAIVHIDEAPGVVRVKIPPTLKEGEWYRWYLLIDVFCSPESAAQTDSAEGWTKWEPFHSAIGSQNDVQQQVRRYANAGFLHDALDLAANSRAVWRNLLQSLGLSDRVSEPITNCCEMEE